MCVCQDNLSARRVILQGLRAYVCAKKVFQQEFVRTRVMLFKIVCVCAISLKRCKHVMSWSLRVCE